MAFNRLWIGALALFALSGCQQTRGDLLETQTGARISREYDRFTQETRLHFSGFQLHWTNATRLKAEKYQPKDSEEASTELIFTRTNQQAWKWSENSSVIFLVDRDHPFPLGVYYQHRIVNDDPENISLDETLTVPITQELVDAMIAAKTLEIRVDQKDFEVQKDDLKELQEFLAMPCRVSQ